MININLLPWREELRQERDRQMLSISVGIWVLCAAIIFAVYNYIGLKQEHQQNRNRYLTEQIMQLDEKITEIRGLQAQKTMLINRMDVIQNLQRERTQVVHLFNDIVQKLPDGVYYRSLDKKGKTFSLQGTAQSNVRVSDLMNRLDSSDWFANPDLTVVTTTQDEGASLSQFSLKVSEEYAAETQE